MQNTKIYDVIIIGGGPAGYTAAMYAARAGFKTLIVERVTVGGQMTQTTQIDNYPGFSEGIDGVTLGFQMQAGAERFGAETVYEEVTKVALTDRIKTVETESSVYLGKTVIVATGADHKHLGVPGEEEMVGRGVSYCAACDGMFYRDKTVVVVGGGNSAVADALVLSRIAKEVILVHRRDTLRATKVYHNALNNAPNVTFKWNSRVKALHKENVLTAVTLEDVHTGEETQISCQGLFVSIGRQPATALFAQQLELDAQGYIVADESTRTNLPGVYAAGDVRTKALRQIVTATADGAAAVHCIEGYLAEE